MPNPPRGTQSSELLKLAEKFRKDPTSKLFFPLAEEYLKAGLIDDAIALLRQGRRAHPDLLSARVALGKALLQKGLRAEAQTEFEQVIVANPDNLMAQKKLADIYLQAQNKTAAESSCRAVLALNPNDSEVLRILEQVNRLPVPAREDTMADEPTMVGSPADEATVVDTVIMDEPTVIEPTMVPTSLIEDPTVVGTRVTEPTPTESVAVESTAEPVSPPISPEEDRRPPADPPSDDLATISLADLYVAQGHYREAIDIYRTVLQRVPNHPEASVKLENATTLTQLLQPAPQTSETVRTTVVERVLGRPQDPASPEDDLVIVGSPSAGSRHAAVIERLEGWLAQIERRKRA